MIIVEGADNVGKSTLITKLMERDPKLKLLKRERFKPGMEGTIGRTHIEALLPPNGDFNAHAHSISDRSFFSECIYGPIFRGGCRMTTAEHFQLYALLKLYPTIIVWCDTFDDVITATWAKREQLYEHEPLMIAEAYRRRMPQLARDLLMLQYDWSKDSKTGFYVDKIVAWHRDLLNQSTFALRCP